MAELTHVMALRVRLLPLVPRRGAGQPKRPSRSREKKRLLFTLTP